MANYSSSNSPDAIRLATSGGQPHSYHASSQHFAPTKHQQRPPSSETMSIETHPTHRELDAKLETIEARMDGRLARIEDAVKRISDDNAATRAGISSLKATTIVVAVSSVIAILFGVAAFNSTLLSNMTSSFDSGRDTAKLTSEAQAEISASVAEVRQMIQELKDQQAANK